MRRSCQDLMEVAADAGRPLRAGEFAVAAGLPTDKAKVEGLQSRLKLLVGRGWLAMEPGGPVHAARSRRENSETRTVTRSSSAAIEAAQWYPPNPTGR